MVRTIVILTTFLFSLAVGAVECPTLPNPQPPGTRLGVVVADGVACNTYVPDEFAKEAKTRCESAVKEYKEFQKSDSAFMKGCNATQAKNVSSDGDSLKCLNAALKCQECIGTAEDIEDNPRCQNGENDDEDINEDEGVNGMSALIAAYKGQKLEDNQINDDGEIREMKNRFKYCPVFSKEEFDDFKDSKDDYEDRVKKGEEELAEAMANLKKAQRELKELQEDQAKIVPEYKEAFQKIIKEQEQKLQDQLQKNGDQMVEVILALQTAEMQFIDTKNQIYKVCYDRAQQALDSIKADRKKKISMGQLFSKNGFAGLNNLASKEDRLQKYAEKVRDNCKAKDNSVRDQIKSAERIYSQTLKRLNLQLDKLKAEQNDIVKKLTDAVEDPEEKARLDDLKKEYEKRQEDIARAIAEKAEEVENLTVTYNRIKDELQRNKVLFAQITKQFELIKATGARSKDLPTKGDFVTAAFAFETALDNAADACGCNLDEQVDNTSVTESECTTIRRLMESELGGKTSEQRRNQGNQ